VTVVTRDRRPGLQSNRDYPSPALGSTSGKPSRRGERGKGSGGAG